MSSANDNDTSDIDDLADRYIQQCAKHWARRRLPLNALAAAVTTWGLRYASEEATPAEVAEGLQRMADAIMENPVDRRALI